MFLSQSIHSSNDLYTTHFLETLKYRLLKREIKITHNNFTSNHQINKQSFKSSNKNLNYVSFRFVFVSTSLFVTMTFNEFVTTISEFVSITSKTHALFSFDFLHFRNQHFRKMNLLHTAIRKQMTWKNEKQQSMWICHAIKSIRFFTNFCLFVCRQHVLFRIFAINHDASINKNSKNSNSKNLKQHTFAKSISFCCFCFCLILKYRSIHYINLQIFSRSKFSIKFSFRLLWHIYSVFVLVFLFSNLFFHVYRIYVEIFNVNHDQTNI